MRLAGSLERAESKIVAVAPAGLIAFLKAADLTDPDLQKLVPAVSARATNEEFREMLGTKIIQRYAKKFFLPMPIRVCFIIKNGLPFVIAGIKDLLHKNFSAEIVHASAIAASVLTGDFSTADSIIFLTEVGEMLEEWTYKKSVDDLARSLALNVSEVWKITDGKEELVPLSRISAGDHIKVFMGNMIPVDGIVTEGEANSLEGKISVTTPIAKGLMGKKVGEVAKVQVPAGLMEYEILEISL